MSDTNQIASDKLDKVCELLKEVDKLDNTLTDSICVILLLLNRSRKRNQSEHIEVSFKMTV
jgi:hypothetical protein